MRPPSKPLLRGWFSCDELWRGEVPPVCEVVLLGQVPIGGACAQAFECADQGARCGEALVCEPP